MEASSAASTVTHQLCNEDAYWYDCAAFLSPDTYSIYPLLRGVLSVLCEVWCLAACLINCKVVLFVLEGEKMCVCVCVVLMM